MRCGLPAGRGGTSRSSLGGRGRLPYTAHMQCGRLSGPRRLEARGAGRIRLGSIVCCAAARPARRTPAGPSTGLSGLVGVGMPAGHAQGPRLVRQPQPKDNPAAISGPGMDSAPGPVSGMHQTRAGAHLLNAAQCGPCYARARCGLPAGCVSGVLGELVGAGGVQHQAGVIPAPRTPRAPGAIPPIFRGAIAWKSCSQPSRPLLG